MLMSRYEDEWERQIDVNVKVGGGMGEIDRC